MDAVLSLEHIVTYIIVAAIGLIVPLIVAEYVKRGIGIEYEVMLETVKNANAKALDLEKQSREIRLKSALIAELFAEWTSVDQNRKKLRQLTFEAFLWLPEDLADELSKILSHDDAALDPRTYLIQVRKFLLGQDDALTSEKIITFGLTNEERSRIRY